MFSVHFSPSITYYCISMIAVLANPPNCSCRAACWQSTRSDKEWQYKDDPTSYTGRGVTSPGAHHFTTEWRIIYKQTTQQWMGTDSSITSESITPSGWFILWRQNLIVRLKVHIIKAFCEGYLNRLKKMKNEIRDDALISLEFTYLLDWNAINWKQQISWWM